jgi:hypothetical protein
MWLNLFTARIKELYDLAKSQNPMERRTCYCAYYFIRKNERDTFKIAEVLYMTLMNTKKQWEVG